MWIQLVCLFQVFIALSRAVDQREMSISSDGVNVVCATPSGNGGFIVDRMDIVAEMSELKVSGFSEWMFSGFLLRLRILF